MFSVVSDVLEQAIDELQIPADRDALVRSFRLLDQLTTKIAVAVGDYDQAEMWRDDGAASMTAWLRAHAERTGSDASWLTKAARRLRQLPVTTEALLSGALSVGQLKAMLPNITDKIVDRFAEQETELVPSLTRLTVAGVAEAMQHWRKRAEAELDDDEPPDDEQTVFLSKTLDGRRELKGSLNAETGAALETALRLADQPDLDGEPARTPAQHRADALDLVARFFLDHQNVNLGRRHRPHLNVFVNLDDIVGNDDERSGLPDIDAANARKADRASGWLADGTVLDAATIRRLLCDAGIHRVVTSGRSSILDYGRTTRVITPPMFSALVARDQRCRFPGCDRKPAWCEAHHLVPWEHDGPTELGNLALFCSVHHHLLHHPGWNAKMLANGDIEITRPDGDPLISEPPGRLYDLFDSLRRRFPAA
jgi:Domain of unknown function (DUF222)